MKIVLKLLATPVVMILTVFIGLCVVLLHISALILGLAGTVVALLGLAVLITYSVKKRNHPPGDRVSVKPLWTSHAGGSGAGRVQDVN